MVPEKNNSDSDNVCFAITSPLKKTSKSFDSRMTGYIKLKLTLFDFFLNGAYDCFAFSIFSPLDSR